jgi:hypothetical protein
MRPQTEIRKNDEGSDLQQDIRHDSHHLPTDACKRDPELAVVMSAWPTLVEAIKVGMLAMLKAAVRLIESWQRLQTCSETVRSEFETPRPLSPV